MSGKKIGYSFWGYLGDVKFANSKPKIVSTPDGNAFYSWAIIKAFQDKGYDVLLVMPDRDIASVCAIGGPAAFQSFALEDRLNAWTNAVWTLPLLSTYDHLNKEDVFAYWDKALLNESEAILHEWRMEIPGRNDDGSRELLGGSWQPDLFIQECLIDYCELHNIKLVIFDLDYKLSKEDVERLQKRVDVKVLELGSKWGAESFARHVEIPFDFNHMSDFDIKQNPYDKLIYVGSRYERDWCIDKYVDGIDGFVVYGNWLESGRDSRVKWPCIDFRHRLQTTEMHNVYSNAVATVLLAKHNYCKYHFMTARILEAVFYGCVPFFIEEYGGETIKKYAGDFAELLTVHDAQELESKANTLAMQPDTRSTVLHYLRSHLDFMDSGNFVNDFFIIARS